MVLLLRSGPVSAYGKVLSLEDSYLHLRICPTGDFNNHVQYRLLLIGVQRDIVEGGNDNAIFLNVDPMIECVGLAQLPHCVAHGDMMRGLGRKVLRYLTKA